MKGILAGGDRQTVAAGVHALRAGGNAVDAAIGAAFAAFVTEAPLASAAGGGVLISGEAKGEFEAWYLFTSMPGCGAQRPEHLDFRGVTVDFGATTQEFHVGRGAAAVPTALPALIEMHQARGRLPLSQLCEPAARLAREGCHVSAQVASIYRLLQPIFDLTPEIRAVYQPLGRLPQAGTRIRNGALADLFDEVGRDTSSALGRFRASAVEGFGPARGGLLTMADLEAPAARCLSPLRVDFRGREVLLPPLPASGGRLVGDGLRVAEAFDWDTLPFGGAAYRATMANVLAAVDEIHRQRVGAQMVFDGCIPDAQRDGLIRDAARRVARALGSTTHISVVDGEGGCAALTVSNGEGCGSMMPGLGVHMNNFLGEEDINPGGFHCLSPGTPLTTMMTPTVVVRDGIPEVVLGTGGSNRIRSVIIQNLVNHLACRESLDVSVLAPRVHVEGEQLWFERADHGDEVLRNAWPRHAMFPELNMYFGGVNAVGRRPDGTLCGVGDPRRGGAVARV